MKVSNLQNANGGVVVNQFVIEDGRKTIFQSYESMICTIDRDQRTITFFADWNYSRTTMRHLNTFLRYRGFFEFSDFSAARKGRLINEAGSNARLINGYTIVKGW